MRMWTCLFILLIAAGTQPRALTAPAGAERQAVDRGQGMSGRQDDLEVLSKLNQDYVDSVQRSDVKRFGEILSDDFLCTMADGSLLDRKAFLEQTARPVTIKNLQAHDVNVRLMGDFAIIHARTSYTTADGKESGGRYTDVWARRGGRWLAVSAHVTRR